MKNLKGILLGALLIVLGIIFALNTLGITDINIFFDGWWTLFIIIPCLWGLFTERDKTGAVIGLIIGVALLLSAQNVIDFSTLLKLIFPILLVALGIKIIVGGFLKSKENSDFPKSMPTPRSYASTFSSQNLNFDGQVFEGATLSAAFGGIELDLRNAIIDKDIFINASAAFGGIDIFLPQDVNIKVKSSAIFGGVDCKRKKQHVDGARTVYIKADAAFGGIDIK